VNASWKLATLDAPGNSRAERSRLLLGALRAAQELEHTGRLTAQQQDWPRQIKQALDDLNAARRP
jgi:hypothetical protein